MVRKIIGGNANTTINSWCRNTLTPDYVKDVLEDEDTNLILTLTDSKDNIRGIALLSVQRRVMELIVLCNNDVPGVKLKSNRAFGRGSMLLKLIKFLGKDLGDGIKLYALEAVITLYHKFGWKFIDSCKGKERTYIPGGG